MEENTSQRQEGQSAPDAATVSLVLPGLNDVDWAQLEHAYGEAEDTPKWLQVLYRAACSDADADNDEVNAAFAELDASVTHQGSRYTASQAAVPFVYAVLDAAAQKHHTLRAELLTFLGILAVGSPKYWLPSRADTVEWRASAAERQAPSWPDDEMERREAFLAAAEKEAKVIGDWSEYRRQEFRVEVMTEPEQMAATSLAELGTYDAVRAGLASVYKCLSDRDGDYPNVRSEAAFLLALFPEPGTVEASEEVLRDQLARETVATVRGTILLALGILRQQKRPRKEGTGDKDLLADMHPKVEVVEGESDHAARASTRRLLEEIYAAATVKRHRGDATNNIDADAHFEQWCSATALLLLVGVENMPEQALSDVLAPMIDAQGVFPRYEPAQLVKQATKARKAAKAAKENGESERSEDQKKSERSEDKSERSEDQKRSEQSEDQSFPFPSEDLASFVAPLLDDVRGSEHPEVARVVIDHVVGAQRLSGIELANTALQLVFDGERCGWLPFTKSEESTSTLPRYAALTPLQQSAVSAVARVDESCWKYANFKSMLLHWGLPADKTQLENYVADREAKKDAGDDAEE